MNCPLIRTNARAVIGNSGASGSPAVDAVTRFSGRPKTAGRVGFVGDTYRLVETTPTA